MEWLRWSSIVFLNAIVAATEPRLQYRNSRHFSNSTNASIAAGTYLILRAEIVQSTINIATMDNSTLLTSQETFQVITQGVNQGALPVKCGASWESIFAIYPAIMPLSCTDPNVNATLVQEEVWPEDGGFYVFVEFNGANPAAWRVGDHLSSSVGWNYEPLTNASWPPGGRWIWCGSLVIDQMPDVSLQNWNRPQSSYP